MVLTRAKFERFTAFEDLDVEFSPGINVFVGENGTGKTHLMKACYAACAFPNTGRGPIEKLRSVFLPADGDLSRIIRKSSDESSREGSIELSASFDGIPVTFDMSVDDEGSDGIGNERGWSSHPIKSAYIPVKDMLANAPGFRSLYNFREIHFEEVYSDILNLAYLPPLKQQQDLATETLLTDIAGRMGGNVVVKNEEFFLNSQSDGMLEFPLVAEGLRKLGLLWLLIKNGTLRSGSILFWDEPETNLNPRLFGTVVNALLTLQRHGLQVFLATHDYVILKELDLQMTDDDNVAFHSLFRDDKTNEIDCRTVGQMPHMHPNAIVDTFSDLYNRDAAESLKRFHKLK